MLYQKLSWVFGTNSVDLNFVTYTTHHTSQIRCDTIYNAVDSQTPPFSKTSRFEYANYGHGMFLHALLILHSLSSPSINTQGFCTAEEIPKNLVPETDNSNDLSLDLKPGHVSLEAPNILSHVTCCLETRLRGIYSTKRQRFMRMEAVNQWQPTTPLYSRNNLSLVPISLRHGKEDDRLVLQV